MEISEKHLEEFIRLYRNRFGKDIDRKEALRQAHMLLRLIELLKQK